jgi:hypothetical protein
MTTWKFYFSCFTVLYTCICKCGTRKIDCGALCLCELSMILFFQNFFCICCTETQKGQWNQSFVDYICGAWTGDGSQKRKQKGRFCCRVHSSWFYPLLKIKLELYKITNVFFALTNVFFLVLFQACFS